MMALPRLPYTSNRRAMGVGSIAAMSTNARARGYVRTPSVLSSKPGTSPPFRLRKAVTSVGRPSAHTI